MSRILSWLFPVKPLPYQPVREFLKASRREDDIRRAHKLNPGGWISYPEHHFVTIDRNA